MEAAGRGGGGGRVGAAPVNPASTHGLPTPRPRGAPHAAPRRRPPPARASPSRLDVMWAAGLARRRGRGPSGRSRGARSAPCALRRAPGPYAPPPPPPPRHIWKRSARLPPARRAGGEGAGAGAGAAAGWAGGGERGALARPVSPSRCLCRNSSCQNGARRGAARPGAAASLPAPAPQELPELLDRKEPSRGLRKAGQERRRRFSPCWPGRPSLPVWGPSLPSPLLSASSRAASLGLFFQTV